MQIAQGIRDLVGPVECRAFGQGLPDPFQHTIQVLTLHVVHHQVLAIIIFGDEIVGNLGQARMVEPGQDTGLGQELLPQPGQHLWIFVGAGSIFLNGAAPPDQPLILGQVDRAHRAETEHTDEPVPVG